MSALLEINQLTVQLPTAQGWVRLVNEVSFTRDLLAAVPEVAARH